MDELQRAINNCKTMKTEIEFDPGDSFSAWQIRRAKRKALETAISAMQELQEYREIGAMEECREAIKRQQDKWIPVTWHETTEEDEIDMERYPLCLDFRMPEEGQEILVSTKSGRVDTDTCGYYDAWTLDSGMDWVEDIVAWQPLPEPYREENDGKINGMDGI